MSERLTDEQLRDLASRARRGISDNGGWEISCEVLSLINEVRAARAESEGTRREGETALEWEQRRERTRAELRAMDERAAQMPHHA